MTLEEQLLQRMAGYSSTASALASLLATDHGIILAMLRHLQSTQQVTPSTRGVITFWKLTSDL